MRVRDGKKLLNVLQSDFPSNNNSTVTCDEIFQLKGLSKWSGNPTEPIIVQLLSNYLSLDTQGKRDGIRIFWGPIYKGISENNQEIDIAVEYHNKIAFGISIKTKFGGGYLEKADLNLRLIREYKDSIKRFEERGSVSDVLQDMARIQNIKDKIGDFDSVTILYCKPSKKKWVKEFTEQYNHQYIFLEGNQRPFFEEIGEKLPILKKLVSPLRNEGNNETVNDLKGESDGKGRGVKGSKLLIQRYVNDRTIELNRLILSSSPSLLSFLNDELSIKWKSPLKEENYREYRNEFLAVEKEWVNKRLELEKYWATTGPSWDGLAIVEGKSNQKGLLLVEAKAHRQEMKSKRKATDLQSINLIKSTIQLVKNEIDSKASLDVWLDKYYQLANRLAYLYILNEKLQIPTWLILVNFVDDTTYIPTDLESWIKHYHEVFTKMDLNMSSNTMLGKIISIFPQ